ncbi:MAG: hypothetical protein MZW92_43155 [Comamonadaceae bacterium]|nr:hypothetical protein [Comamonadaceae bacterium]
MVGSGLPARRLFQHGDRGLGQRHRDRRRRRRDRQRVLDTVGGLSLDPRRGCTADRVVAGVLLCSAGGVSGDGATVVGTCLRVNNTAYRWTAATGAMALTRFGGGSNQQSSAAAISLDAALVVGAGHPVLTGAVTWAADGSSTVLGLLPGDAEATATAVSRDGSTVVGASKSATGGSASVSLVPARRAWSPSAAMSPD